MFARPSGRRVGTTILAVIVAAGDLAAQDSTLVTGPRLDTASPTRSTGALPAVGDAATRGFSVSVIERSEIAGAPTLSAALAARLPGVSVLQRSGTLGAGSRVWFRGPTSMFVNEPLLIVDGVRVHATQTSGNESSALVSRLDDIDPESVERIEILRGAAASAIYGPGASKGVILVTTRSAEPGPARWTAYAESGGLTNQTSFPMNFGRAGVSTANGAPVPYCPLRMEAAGSCTPSELSSWNPLEQASPFRTGWTNSAGVSLTGGSSAFSYSANAGHDRGSGIFDASRSGSTSIRFNVDAIPTNDLDLGLTIGYLNGRTHFAPGGGGGVLAAGLFGQAADDPVGRGYRPGYVASLGLEREDVQSIDRLTIGASAVWRARSWLETRASLGMDDVDRHDRFGLVVPNVNESGDTTWFASTEMARSRPQTTTAAVDATASYFLRSTVAASTVLGVDYWIAHEGEELRERSASSLNVHGLRDFNNMDPGSLFSESGRFWYRRVRTLGVRVGQHVAWRDRLFAAASVRANAMPGGGPDRFDPIVSSAADVSWTLLDRREAGENELVRSARLRAAWGQGGDFLIHHVALVGPPSVPSLDPPPPPRAPERSTETEVGADVSLLGGRVRAAVTYYSLSVDMGLVPNPGDPPFNFPSAVADVDGNGWETLITARLVSHSFARWDVAAAYWSGTQSLEAAMPATRLSPTILIGPRAPIGGIWSQSATYADVDGNGLLGFNEMTMQDDFGLLGIVHPRREASLRNTVEVGPVTIAATLDHRGGHHLINEVEELRCLFSTCRAASDPSSSLAEQARVLALITDAYRGQLDRGDFTRLREVSISTRIPGRWVASARTARFTVTGRNLATWTSFRGLDPEVATTGSPGVTPPLARWFVARFDVAW